MRLAIVKKPNTPCCQRTQPQKEVLNTYKENTMDEQTIDEAPEKVIQKKAEKIEIKISSTDEEGNLHRLYSEEDSMVTDADWMNKKGTGKPYVSVEFMGHQYGASYPCTDEEAVKRAIENQKQTITEAGDIPIVIDLRQIKTLEGWM